MTDDAGTTSYSGAGGALLAALKQIEDNLGKDLARVQTDVSQTRETVDRLQIVLAGDALEGEGRPGLVQRVQHLEKRLGQLEANQQAILDGEARILKAIRTDLETFKQRDTVSLSASLRKAGGVVASLILAALVGWGLAQLNQPRQSSSSPPAQHKQEIP